VTVRNIETNFTIEESYGLSVLGIIQSLPTTGDYEVVINGIPYCPTGRRPWIVETDELDRVFRPDMSISISAE
jgi:hypothetical protein